MGIMTNGVQQWVFQRVSNVVFIIFAVVLLKTILTQGLTYDGLNALLDTTVFKVYALMTLLFAGANSILAGWQITGDYAAKFNIPPALMMGVTVIVSVFYVVWGGMLLL
jgi:succinate dehydrogenase / fumarate reductase, membrane anchor subunit